MLRYSDLGFSLSPSHIPHTNLKPQITLHKTKKNNNTEATGSTVHAAEQRKSAALIRQIQPSTQLGGEKKRTTEKQICPLFPNTASFPEDKAKKCRENQQKWAM